MHAVTVTASGAIGAADAMYAIRGFAFTSDTAGEAVITSTAGTELGRLKTTTEALADALMFTGVLQSIGMDVTLAAGTDMRLTVYLE